ncbi:potassium channel family protein [Aquibacillus salsiterrae]|uniref:TrkA family potassium uptake protein n=1 Tax=Aquibacillus salsiterrae TaxID=2950439 RepID=A0A9X4AF68_9BACI|nr:TrkA family potassium uptake protein [Aquibacillus salsiterrae]MDC3417339.1 TrkA family potassium uptake protein [Aquibacillus salsiterrae]
MKHTNKEFVVIGLGRFGSSLCQELTSTGVNVMAIDKDGERVQDFHHVVTQAVELDATDEEQLKAIGIRNFDCVVVSIGENLQSSILITLILKELGIKQVWVKARNEHHAKVLDKIGADRVLHPERDMAKRIAHHIGSDTVADYIELTKDYSIVEIVVSDKLSGKRLLDLEMKENFNCAVVAVKKGEDDVIVTPSNNIQLEKDDIIVTIGKNQDIDRFEENQV